MIEITATLVCDGCRTDGGQSFNFVVPVLRKALEEPRRKGHAKGWATYRLTNTSSFGDYCPRCQKAHAAAKAKGRKPEGERSRGTRK